MYAIVEIAGQQFKASKDDKLFVHRLSEKEGVKVSFDNVLLFDDGKKVKVGDPKVSGASVEAKILNHCKGDKIIVFKKKRRKGYRVKNGHRQFFTELLIESISEKRGPKKAEVKTNKVKEVKSDSKDLNLKKVTPKKTVSSKPKVMTKKNSAKKK
ncbi:MAG: 50S ribosomal protein L21 [Flavobacteriaceae bacterium]